MRDRTLALIGLGAIAALGGLVWLSHHPDTPALERASRWPLIGPAASAFRDRYRTPGPAREPEEGSGGLEVVYLRIEVPEPSPASTARSPSRSGRVPETGSGPEAGIDRSVLAPGPLPARAADPGRLARAVELVGSAVRRGSLGPYGWVADFDPPPRWAEIAGGLDAAFARRTGREPLGRPAETVVALATDAAYRELLRYEPRLREVDAEGHAGSGLAVIRADPEGSDSGEAVLVHELVHLVARRALGPALPVWLEEGLAEDFAQAPWDAEARRPLHGRVRGAVQRIGSRVEISGARAGLDQLVAEMERGEMPTLEQLVEMDWERFVGEAGPLRYAQALQVVRFLLDGGDPELARGFRSYLEGIAAGGPFDRAALEAAVGLPLDELEAPFRAWLAMRRQIDVRVAVEALMLPGERLSRPQTEPSGSSSRQADDPSS